jgi:hypothetical protein
MLRARGHNQEVPQDDPLTKHTVRAPLREDGAQVGTNDAWVWATTG